MLYIVFQINIKKKVYHAYWTLSIIYIIIGQRSKSLWFEHFHSYFTKRKIKIIKGKYKVNNF